MSVHKQVIEQHCISCFEAHEDGTMTIYAEDEHGVLVLRVSEGDVARMMVSGMDALRRHWGRR